MKARMLRRVLPALFVGAVFTGCDFDVVNPGPVQDVFLEEPDAQPALVAGAGRAFAQGLNWVGYTSSAVAREIHPSGSTGSFGIALRWQRGELPFDEIDTHWEQAQRARWLAEEAVRVINDVGESESGLLAQAYLWSGYANRLLGESMCQAVIDGSAPQDVSAHLQKAVQDFSEAASRGSGDVRTAAIAGRASVYAQLGQWNEAVNDAAQVADDFSYVLPYYDTEGDDQRNRLVFAAWNEPYKAHTQWNTWVGGNPAEGIEPYGLSSDNPDGDPRVSYRVSGETGDAAVECCGQVDWWPQTKYDDPGGDVELSSGPEMRLLEAEKFMMDGNVDAAMDKVNALRAAAGVDEVDPTSTSEAWSFFKREHAIEMWLEGRRLGALRRWQQAGLTEDDLHIYEQVSGDVGAGSHLVTRDYCYPIAETECDTNLNVSCSG